LWPFAKLPVERPICATEGLRHHDSR
jgi:hypothetical protein